MIPNIKIEIPQSEINKLVNNIQNIVNGDLEKHIRTKTKEASEYLRNKIKEGYLSPEGKAAISNVTAELRERQGGNTRIPLYQFGHLANSVIAKQDHRTKKSEKWKVQMTPSRHHPSGAFGKRSNISISRLAELHETGFTTKMPKAGKRYVPARPVWERVWNKEKDKVHRILTNFMI